MKLLSIVPILFVLLSCDKSPQPKTQAVINSEQPASDAIVVDLVERNALGEFSETREIAFHDPIYGKEKRFSGFSLRALLHEILAKNDADTTGLQIFFQCVDGYSPSMPLSKALAADGWIATQDLSSDSPGAWEPIPHGKEFISPAPFYLVWPEIEQADRGYPRPYQLTTLRMTASMSIYDGASPGDDVRAMRGFETFKKECVSCHSINLVGGSVGPELNAPKNITEYWKIDDIRRFIRNPASYRARNKMSAFPHLTEPEMDDLLYYIEAMKYRKIQF